MDSSYRLRFLVSIPLGAYVSHLRAPRKQRFVRFENGRADCPQSAELGEVHRLGCLGTSSPTIQTTDFTENADE